MAHHVLLVPGFFGFANLGDFAYFRHFREILTKELAEVGVQATVTPVDTLPTRSIRARASHLLGHVKRLTAEGDSVYIVGHSTGGLDARLLGSSQLDIPGHADVADRLRGVITVATPHRGTPIAAFFTSMLGQRLLRLLSLSTIAAIRLGSIPLPALALLGGAVASTGALNWASGGVFDQVYRLVLRDFSPERQKELEQYFDQAQSDQTLLMQLTPEAMDLVDALAVPLANVRCASVVSAAPRPSIGRQAALGVNPSWQATYGLFRGLHLLTSRTGGPLAPKLSENDQRLFEESLGWSLDSMDNDGMVPAVSQVWGRLIHVACADHMDVMGHFHDPPAHVDWLRTGSNFGPAEFRALLAAIAAFIAE